MPTQHSTSCSRAISLLRCLRRAGRRNARHRRGAFKSTARLLGGPRRLTADPRRAEWSRAPRMDSPQNSLGGSGRRCPLLLGILCLAPPGFSSCERQCRPQACDLKRKSSVRARDRAFKIQALPYNPRLIPCALTVIIHSPREFRCISCGARDVLGVL